MMISWFYVFFFYLVSLILFLNYSNPLLFWVMMELNLLSFSLIFLLDKSGYIKQDSLNYLVYYFLIQSSASILFLSNFSFSDIGGIFNIDDMFLVSLTVKIGLFPLFFWVFNISKFLNLLGLGLLLTLQKIPLLMAFFTSSSSIFFILIFMSFLSGSLMLLYSSNLIFMLISSSISYSFFMYLIFSYSFTLYITFFITYSIFLMMALSFNFSKDLFSSNVLFLVFSFFMGLPPLSLFFFKFIFCVELISSFGFTEMVLFWILSFVSLVGYVKFFYHSFYEVSSLYLKNEFLFKNLTFIFSVISFFLFSIW